MTKSKARSRKKPLELCCHFFFCIPSGHPALMTATIQPQFLCFCSLISPCLQVSFLWPSEFCSKLFTPFPSRLFFPSMCQLNLSYWVNLMLFLSLCLCRGLSVPIPSSIFSAFRFFANSLFVVFTLPFLIFTSPLALSPSLPLSALLIPPCHFPSEGALCGSCLSISAVGTQFWAPGPVCVEGKLCLGKQVPTPAPGITKKAFFAHQWLPLTPGPLPLEGMSGFPRWHTEMAIIEAGSRGAGASWECRQDRDGGVQRVWGGVLCSKPSAVCIRTQTHKRTQLFPRTNWNAHIGVCMSGFAFLRALEVWNSNFRNNLRVVHP